MKKALVIGYTMDMGGAEIALINVLELLKEQYKIDLILLEKKGILLSKIPQEVNIMEVKTNIFKYTLFRYVPFFRKKIMQKMANKKYDLAIAFMEGRAATLVADLNQNCKKIAWIHNDVEKFDIGISEKEIIDSYNKMNKIICVSKDAKSIFCKKYNIDSKKVDVIYNFIDEKEIIKKSKEFKVENNCFTFVNVAKMRDQKRQDRLVNAAKYLKDKGYNFKIQLIGDGPNLEKIKKLVTEKSVEDKVEVMGLKENPYPYIKNADFFVLCSDMEGYSIVTKEALLLKTKIVTTDVVGPREILQNGKYGVIISNDDFALIKELENILKNKKDYDYLENNIKNYKGDNKIIQKQLKKLFNIN